MEMSGELHAPAGLYSIEEPCEWPQSLSEFCGEEKHLSPLLGREPRFLGRTASSLVTKWAGLSHPFSA
jgi:hypothetical protein